MEFRAMLLLLRLLLLILALLLLVKKHHQRVSAALAQHDGDLVAQTVEDAVEVERDRAVPVVHVVVGGEPARFS